MARSFISDNIGFTESALTDGTASGTTFSSASNVINESRAIDMSIATAFTSFNDTDTLRFNVGAGNASKTANCIALHYTSDHGHNFEVYRGSSATAMGTAILDHRDQLLAGWNVITFSATAGQYWFLRSTSGTIDDITEIIVGTKYDFAVNPELNAKTGEEFGTDIMTSYGGNEYANKRHAPKTTWDLSFSHILSTQKDAFQTLNTECQEWKKFIYSEDATTHHYVRLAKPMAFTEVAPDVYSTNISLREQI